MRNILFQFTLLFSLLLFTTGFKVPKPSEFLKVKYKARVLFFFSTECPLCLSYTNDLQQMFKKYSSQNISFLIVYPNKERKIQVEKFQRRSCLSIPFIMDKHRKISESHGITITPEVILQDSTGKLIYRGSIDNRAYAPSAIRKVITEHYLSNAINSYMSGIAVEPAYTQPVGCYLQEIRKRS